MDHSKTKNIKPDDSVYGLPAVILLNPKHWFYIQKRYHMSPREVQVAKLVCQGLSNEEIAKDLKIKRGTVKTHLRNIYRRIRVKSKIKMLLKFVNVAIKFSIKSGTTPPIPIIDIEKPDKKTSTSFEIP
ncbi:MAG TPA: hypothetical protein ENH34_07625 [Phycisphaerales bacterium]|nr:hypothetical protein [Phycisphaerales bacterium]